MDVPHILNIERRIWGRSGFDRMFGESKLRVSALFRVINEQNNLNANNVIEGNFAPRAYAQAA